MVNVMFEHNVNVEKNEEHNFFDRICVPPIIIIISITFHMILVYFITQEKMEIRYFYDKNYFSDTFII